MVRTKYYLKTFESQLELVNSRPELVYPHLEPWFQQIEVPQSHLVFMGTHGAFVIAYERLLKCHLRGCIIELFSDKPLRVGLESVLRLLNSKFD